MWRFFTKDGAEKRVAATTTNPMTMMYHNATQSISNGVSTVVNFNTVVTATDSGMTAVANRVTITKTGRYLLEAAVTFAFNATGNRQVFFRVNGTIFPSASYNNANAATDTQVSISATADLNSGDYVEVVVQQNSGGALNLQAGSAINLHNCSFTVTKVDGAVASYVGVPGSLVGQELAYAQNVANANITDTVESTGTALLTAPSITVDGVTPIIVEFAAAAINSPTAAAGNFTAVSLFEGATQLARLLYTQCVVAGQPSFLSGTWKYRFTPTAGTHTYKIAGFVSNTTGTPTITASNGGTGNFDPAFIRITRAA